MSDIPRKIPPSESTESAAEDLDSTIDSYIEKSPITTRFRQENPNLHPVLDNDDEMKHLDASIDMLSSRNMSELLSPIQPPELPRRPSGHETYELSGSPSGGAPALPQRSSAGGSPSLPRRSSSTIKNNLMKLTRNRSDEVNNKHNRFSLKSSFNRLSLNNMSKQSPPDSHSYTAEEPVITRNSTHSLSSTSSMTSDDEIYTKPDTPFWKYHILKFGKDLYLTTNPGLKHIYCRNGPGYYVEVVYPENNSTSHHSAQDGFKMVFRDIAAKNDEDSADIMIITKAPKAEGGEYSIWIPRVSFLDDGALIDLDGEDEEPPVFHEITVPTEIDHKYIPYNKISKTNETVSFKNYEFKDFHGIKWNIGSIPRIKSSKMSKMKNKLNDDRNEPLYKFVGKRYIYFHQNYTQGSPTTYKSNSNDPRDIYLHESNNLDKFPPVLGLFRPNETRTRKKLIQKFSQQTSKLEKLKNQLESIHNEKINYKLIDHDIGAGADIKNYFTGGDGLYYLDKNPHDDTPDSNKLGWLTIYEDCDLFSGVNNKGMFDIVLGLTLAVGVESCLD